MQIVVRCTEAQKAELTSRGVRDDADLVWAFEKGHFLLYQNADALIDLLFEENREPMEIAQKIKGLKIINSVLHTLEETDTSAVRINGWPTFLNGAVIEAACLHEDLKNLAQAVFSCFDKTIEWLPDAPGFVVPRVVSLIINEAHFALAEGVSTRSEIDTAMKLGTAYPFGPFEWSEKIGAKNIVALLQKLSMQQKRYTPAPLLVQQSIT